MTAAVETMIQQSVLQEQEKHVAKLSIILKEEKPIQTKSNLH